MQNLSKTQKVRLLKLNLRLQNLQEKIIKEAVKLDIELSKRVADGAEKLGQQLLAQRHQSSASSVLTRSAISSRTAR